MLATYASLIAVCAASLAIGQAALALCGWRRWSWLAPAVGLALLTALCWGTVRLPGEGVTCAVAAALATAASAAFLRGRLDGLGEALRDGAPVAVAALLAASLPFLVEGRFGILGTGFNPDMSQHLLAAERLVDGSDTMLIAQGYPLGPHAIAVALHDGLGAGLVQAFGGVTVAVAVLASLTALAALSDLRPPARWAAALLVALPYMVASYLAQGAFKETMQALFLLAFAIGLWRLSAGPNAGLAAVPLAALAAGSVYAYSFPGLAWMAGALAIWALAELALAMRAGERAGELLRRALRLAWPALAVFAVLAAPELGRMIEFGGFETFDPDGPGLGNLFNPVSPLEALGVWPSGDFRLDPGDGAAPAWSYWLGGVAAAAATGYGLVWWTRRRELALPAALLAAGLLVLYAHLAGTPYQEAKAIALAAPLAMLVATRALLQPAPAAGPTARPAGPPWRAIAGAAFAAAAGTCSLAALANGPVGPASYSPVLAELRPLPGSTLVLAPQAMLTSEHGRPYLAWELRGGRVCVEEAGRRGRLPPGIAQVLTVRAPQGAPPFPGLVARRRAGDYALWAVPTRPAVQGHCPFVATGQRAEPG